MKKGKGEKEMMGGKQRKMNEEDSGKVLSNVER